MKHILPYTFALCMLLSACSASPSAPTNASSTTESTEAPATSLQSGTVSETASSKPSPLPTEDFAADRVRERLGVDFPFLKGYEETFIRAAEGDSDAQVNIASICEEKPYLGQLYRSYGFSLQISSEEAYYTALGKYFDPSMEESTEHDAQKALWWYEGATHKGGCEAAIRAGDMYFRGEGINKDQEKAVGYYASAMQSDTRNGIAFVRMADCYDRGLGVAKDEKKALELYWEAYLLYGSADAFAALLERVDQMNFDETQKLLAYKMLGASLHMGTYTTGHTGLFERDFDAAKIHNPLLKAWEKNQDEALKIYQDGSERDDFFPQDLIREMKKYMYAWKHGFDERYILYDNHDEDDADALEPLLYEDPGGEGTSFVKGVWERYGYAEYDFDGDGENELFLRGINGTGEYLWLGFWKENEKGMYEEAFYLPSYQGTINGLYMFRYEKRIYFLFIQNVPLLDTTAAREIHTFDKDGVCHSIRITPYHSKYGDGRFAFSLQGDGDPYYCKGLKESRELRLRQTYDSGNQVLSERPLPASLPDNESAFKESSDFISFEERYEWVDIDNDGQYELLQKALLHRGWKSQNDVTYFFNIMQDESEIASTASLEQYDTVGYVGPRKPNHYSGVLSRGNLHKYFPVGTNVVQVWVERGEIENKGEKNVTYILHRQDSAYTLDAYLLENGQSELIRRNVFVDEPTDYRTTFKPDGTFNYWANH